MMPAHSETRALPWTARQMYGLVADIERYPEFLPWTAAARIRSRQGLPGGGECIDADLVISFKVFRERFGSRVILDPETWTINTAYLDGPFRHLRSRWTFRDLGDDRCEVAFQVDFEFRNALLQKVIGVVFDEAMRRVVKAFEARAMALYGLKG